ncbi:hypothetical protein ACN42_g757 [Penicillium freii]|uniref:Uncharacterized protein n=1 Tax=Penicillium freii TaxID=48697 RepID=A0A101MT79_PENFR|nr:hypothetical protein ACN42_g757 [Penicillium freii]
MLKKKKMLKKKSLPRGIEPRSPALIGINDKRKSSPLDQGRCDGRVNCSATWLVDENTWSSCPHEGFPSKYTSTHNPPMYNIQTPNLYSYLAYLFLKSIEICSNIY